VWSSAALRVGSTSRPPIARTPVPRRLAERFRYDSARTGIASETTGPAAGRRPRYRSAMPRSRRTASARGSGPTVTLSRYGGGSEVLHRQRPGMPSAARGEPNRESLAAPTPTEGEQISAQHSSLGSTCSAGQAGKTCPVPQSAGPRHGRRSTLALTTLHGGTGTWHLPRLALTRGKTPTSKDSRSFPRFRQKHVSCAIPPSASQSSASRTS